MLIRTLSWKLEAKANYSPFDVSQGGDRGNYLDIECTRAIKVEFTLVIETEQRNKHRERERQDISLDGESSHKIITFTDCKRVSIPYEHTHLLIAPQSQRTLKNSKHERGSQFC